MRFINRGRGSGKTAMCISTSYMTGMPIVVYTTRQKKYIKELADKMGCPIDVYTFMEFKDQSMHHHYNGVILDEMEDIIEEALDNYLGTHVIAGTMTREMFEYKLETENVHI